MTPFGILAKILDGSDDEGDPSKAAEKNNKSDNLEKAYECADEEEQTQ